ncbi:hypothetical protein GCM10020219_033250 [Nonomuraea dietziae]
MISTSQDLATFISALVGGRLLPAPLLAEMCTPHATGIPNMDYGLGVFVQKTDCGGTVITHNGGNVGSASLMYSTPGGGKTLTAVLTGVDDAGMSIAAAFQTPSEGSSMRCSAASRPIRLSRRTEHLRSGRGVTEIRAKGATG